MENSDPGDEGDESASRRSIQMNRLDREEDFYRFVNNLSEEDYKLMRDNDLLGHPGESTEDALLRRLEQFKENPPQNSDENTDESDSSDDVSSGESVINWLISIEQTENATSEQREHQYYGDVSQVPESAFTRPSRSEQNTTEVLLEIPPTSGQQRARSISPGHQRTRVRSEILSPPRSLHEFFHRIDQDVSSPTFEEPLINETQIPSRTQHEETLTQQITGLDLQNGALFATSGTRNAVPRESSPDTISEHESWRLRQITPTISFSSEIQLVHPEAHFERGIIPSRIQITSDTPINTVTLEYEQGRLSHVLSHSEQAEVRAYVSTTRVPTATTSVTIESNLWHTITDLSDSGNLTNSDSDLESSLSPLNHNMEKVEPPTGRESSNSSRSSGSNSNPSCDARSSPVFISSSIPNYMFNSSSNLMSSSSSSDEIADMSLLMFERHDERNLSLDSSSENRQYSRSMTPVSFDESDSWASLDLDQLFLLSDDYNLQSGLTKAQIDNLPIRYFGESDALKACTICITEYTEGNRLRTLPCSHEYHVYCIDSWLTDNSTCPICRRKVVDSDETENSN